MQAEPYWKTAAEAVAAEMNVKLNYEFIDGETYKTKIKVSVTANELPDVYTQFGGVAERSLILDSKSAAPLNDALQSTGLESKFNEGYLIKESDGNIYSLPYRSDMSQVLFYNKKLLADTGKEPPKTWDDFIALVQAAREKGIVPMALGGKDRWPGDLIYNTLVLREDPTAYERAQRGEIKFTEEPFVTAADKVRELVGMNAFQEGFLSHGDLEAKEMFIGGKALMWSTGSWAFTDVIAGMGDNLGYVPFPQVDGVDTNDMNMGDRSNAPYGLFVNPGSAHLEKAKEFAIRLSLKLNDEQVKAGQPAYAVTDAKPEGTVNEAYAQYLQDMSKTKYIQTYWFSTVPAAVGEEYRDWNQKLYTGKLSSQEYTETLEKIWRKQ
jgi:raffinose/stachyose/melibiose transport system substrate-binding protein